MTPLTHTVAHWWSKPLDNFLFFNSYSYESMDRGLPQSREYQASIKPHANFEKLVLKPEGTLSAFSPIQLSKRTINLTACLLLLFDSTSLQTSVPWSVGSN